MEAAAQKLSPITYKMAKEKYDLARTTLDRKVKQGIFQKFTLPGSSKIYLDENEIINAFTPKK